MFGEHASLTCRPECLKRLLTESRKKHFCHGNRLNRRFYSDSDEKIEDLGRGAVVRLIGNLGMGRYAHRFRAFAVTGSDLASCTEDDLMQIGISFRCVVGGFENALYNVAPLRVNGKHCRRRISNSGRPECAQAGNIFGYFR